MTINLEIGLEILKLHIYIGHSDLLVYLMAKRNMESNIFWELFLEVWKANREKDHQSKNSNMFDKGKNIPSDLLLYDIVIKVNI